MYYLVHWDMESGQKISAKLSTRSEVKILKEVLSQYELVEVGPVSYWFMSHGFPRLAMLPFWE